MDAESDESRSVVAELRAVVDVTAVLMLYEEDFLCKWDLRE
eukprot:CAMPEP_0201927746 /NCGR_PEP_ID=MMETSP0903-20130614/19388_1 /ASSEMBLY_ACC=CAM_ASM_000552 /TAXON_ID=420261 /ORGANISM="Thalassiosira antarctica, Strain CCMP982" /LENGTH=40 /DNA_ID= /DNA_START= /DNA_END= /DNA_ORIENTATION=